MEVECIFVNGQTGYDRFRKLLVKSMNNNKTLIEESVFGTWTVTYVLELNSVTDHKKNYYTVKCLSKEMMFPQTLNVHKDVVNEVYRYLKLEKIKVQLKKRF